MTRQRLLASDSTDARRLGAVEGEVRRLAGLAAASLQIPPYMRGATLGQTLSGGKPLFDPQGLIQVNPSVQLVDTYAIPVGLAWTEIASNTLPAIGHPNVVFVAFACATLNFSEPGGVPDTLMISLTLDGATPFINLNAAASPTNGSVSTQSGPFANLPFIMPIVFWRVQIPDLASHRISLMAGKTGGSFVSNQARLLTEQFGN